MPSTRVARILCAPHRIKLLRPLVASHQHEQLEQAPQRRAQEDKHRLSEAAAQRTRAGLAGRGEIGSKTQAVAVARSEVVKVEMAHAPSVSTGC
jgi:hypothetical protein